MAVKTTTQQVGSHLGPIQFGPCTVPIGFLGSFRKLSHAVCMTNNGFKSIVTKDDGRAQSLCECAIERASKRLSAVGKKAFEELGAEWLAKAQNEVAKSMLDCFEQGKRARENASGGNNYPANSDQWIAWNDGYNKGEA